MEDQLLLIDKPVDWTSHDVVNKVRGIFHTRRVGHAGTLDPFATGLLILGVNKATKQLTALVGLDKTYVATARLGATSTTEDTEGTVTETPVEPSVWHIPAIEEIEAMLTSLVCTYEQTASVFSAKKVGGKKMYDLARQGLAHTVEVPKKIITIHSMNLISYNWPELVFEVSCSSGTYIRALARDIGQKLGCGAYLTALRRTRIGDYRIEDAKTLEELIMDKAAKN